MKKFLAIVGLLVLVSFFSCGEGGKPVRSTGHLDNTPYQQDSILLTYGSDPDRALRMLDSAVILGNISDFEEQMDRATIYSKSLMDQRQDSALIICESLLKHDSVRLNINNHESVIDLLINISRAKSDDESYLRWALKKAELCRLQGAETELLRTEAEIGLLMTHLGSLEDGMAKLDHCIKELDKPGSIDRMDAFIIATKRKITVLNELNRPAETIPLAQRVLDRLAHYEQNSTSYAEDSYRFHWSEQPADRERYLDFSRAQAHGYMAIGYAIIGQREKAFEHLKRFDESGYGKTFSSRRFIMPAQISLGLYDEAMATADHEVLQMGADTINVKYATILHDRAIVARAKGHYTEAYDWILRYSEVSKAVSDCQHHSQAHDAAARYHAKEQQLQLEKAESERRLQSIILIGIGILLVISTIATVNFGRQRDRIAEKNRALVRIISEKNHHNHQVKANEETGVTASRIDAKDFALFDDVIRKEHIYANSNLQRQDICDRFGISRIALNNMLSQYVGNPSLPQYINSIRMEEAVKMLTDRPDLSLTAIAEAVGFSPANFRKQFIRTYGMTPLEYRQNQ